MTNRRYTHDDLYHLAAKFCDECELTRDICDDNAVFLRMFLARFLAWTKARDSMVTGAAISANDDKVLQFQRRKELTR